MKNYNFMLIYKKYNKKENIIKNSIVIFFLLVLFVIVLLYGLGKFQILHILTDSSAPYHPAGSLAVEYKVDFNELKVGDFITWSNNKGKNFVTHQIVEIDRENKTVRTCQQRQKADGTMMTPEELLLDNSVSKDEPKTESQYYGKVLFSIPKLGIYMSSVKELVISNSGFNVLGTMTLILVFLAYYLFSKLIYKQSYVLMGENYAKDKKY